MKHKIYKIVALIFLIIFATGVSAQKVTTVHLLFFGATLDKEVGESVRANEIKIRKTFSEIESRYLKMKFHSFTRYRFSKELFYRAVDTLQTNTDDVIIFYYSGHGFRYDDTKSEFPYLLLLKNLDAPDEEIIRISSISLDAVEQYIANKKNVRLKLIIAEACNASYMDVTLPAPPGVLGNPNALKRLFKESIGTYIVCSSKKYQDSYAFKTKGGIFTTQFSNALKKAFSQKEPSWESIFEETRVSVKQQVKKIFNVEQDIYFIRKR